MGPGDLPGSLELSRLAGWNQTETDWRRLFTLAPAGCFCIEESGRVVATTTLMEYDCRCAWIGMVLTHPDWRGRGYARSLFQHTLAIARSRAIPCVKLDATTQGQGLYESFGFAAERVVERWERPGVSAAAEMEQNYSVALDEAAYGYTRADLLASLAGTGRIDAAASCALTRPGAIRSYLGPCVAENPDAAKRLLAPIIGREPEAGWFWDLLVENRYATALASALGFKPVRRLVRMSIGPRPKEQEQNIYALAGLEFG